MATKRRKRTGSYIPEYIIADGTKGNLWEGLVTAIDDPRSIRRGQSPDELNWITSQKGDNIQLRGGKVLIGTTRRIGGHVTGLGIGQLVNGSAAIVFSANESIYYYNGSDTAETTTSNILGSAANGEDVNIFPYTNIAGSWLYATSPHSSIYKISAAHPQSAKDQNYNGILNEYKFGMAKIDQGVFMSTNRFGKSASSRDPSGFYLGRVDQYGASQSGTINMATPGAPTAVVNAGTTIAANTYYYVITSVFGADVGGAATGLETTKGTQSSAVVVGGSGAASIQLTWTKVAGATSYNIYRTTSSGSYTGGTFIGSTTANSDPTAGAFQDTVPTPASGNPPSSLPLGLILTTGIATGDGSTKTFSGNLTFSFSGGRGIPSGFGIQITDGNELFEDDKCGNLVGSLGGTGTIDYITGAYSVTFNTAPANSAPITYFAMTEDPTSGGVIDFTIDADDTTGTYAQVFRQDDGGGQGMGIAAFQGIQYVLHQLRTWNLSIGQSGNDRSYTNSPYWSNIGIPSIRSYFETGDGVLFIDNTDASDPKVSILEIPPGSTNLTVVPVPLSEDLDLSIFSFTKAIVYRFGQYDFMSCIESVNGIPNTYNSKTYMRNIYSGNWNLTDFTPSCLGTYLGNLLMGDALSPNVFQIFSGFDDDGSPINNYWNTSYSDLDLEGLKEIGFIHVSGLIQTNQSIQIGVSTDFGNFVPIFTIQGNASYVNSAIQVEIGGASIGSQVIGSGAGGGSVIANPFEVDIPVHTDLFEYIATQIRALGIGYAEIDKLSYKDCRWKQRSILPTQTFNQ